MWITFARIGDGSLTPLAGVRLRGRRYFCILFSGKFVVTDSTIGVTNSFFVAFIQMSATFQNFVRYMECRIKRKFNHSYPFH